MKVTDTLTQGSKGLRCHSIWPQWKDAFIWITKNKHLDSEELKGSETGRSKVSSGFNSFPPVVSKSTCLTAFYLLINDILNIFFYQIDIFFKKNLSWEKYKTHMEQTTKFRITIVSKQEGQEWDYRMAYRELQAYLPFVF